MPGSSVAVSPEFKRVAKWGISPVFVVRRIPDVKSENRSSWRASTIHRAFNSEVETNREDFVSESTRLILNQAATAPFLSFCDQIGSPRAPLAQKPTGAHFALTVLLQSFMMVSVCVRRCCVA